MSRSIDFAVPDDELVGILMDLTASSADQIRANVTLARAALGLASEGSPNRANEDVSLSHLLAIQATVELAGLIDQPKHAALMVKLAWPEVCRASIAAAVDLDCIEQPTRLPSGAGSLLLIYPDAYGSLSALEVLAARAGDAGSLQPHAPALLLDQRRFLEVLSDRSASSRGHLADALRRLNAQFGWAEYGRNEEVLPVVAPHEATFLAKGPFRARAAAFLRTSASDAAGVADREKEIRRQALYDYLMEPAPLDGHFSSLGTAEGAPWLAHLIASVGEAEGLSSMRQFPAVVTATPENEARFRGLELLARAEEAGY